MSQPTIAVALIIKNEEKHLEACLNTVKGWVDEIIIVDSGSEDNTAEIAKRYTDKFYIHDEWPGFGLQRRLAQSYVTCDYVLWLDADERITPELKVNIQQAVTSNKSNIVYQVDRLSTAFGKRIQYSGWSPDFVTRLYKTKDTQYNQSLVHESVEIPNSYQIEILQGKLLHNTFDELSQYTQKTALYMKLWADQREGKKKSTLSSAIRHALFRFIKMYFIKLGFLDGRHGLLLAILSANTTFTRYADLWLREYINKNKIK